MWSSSLKLVRAQEWLQLNQTWKFIPGCEGSPQHAFFFCTFSCSLLALLLYIEFVAFSFSMPPTVSCIQYSTPQNMYLAEDQPHCPTHPPLSKSAVLPCPPFITRLGMWYSPVSVHMSTNWHSWAWQTHTYMRTYYARTDPSFKTSH